MILTIILPRIEHNPIIGIVDRRPSGVGDLVPGTSCLRGTAGLKRGVPGSGPVGRADSLGNKCNYFEDTDYDEELYAQANLAIDKAIGLQPNRLDYRLVKIDAMMAFEKGSPDMTLQQLKDLADRHFRQQPAWEYEGLGAVSDEQFNAFMQDYCAALFRLGTDPSAEAFKSFSEYLLTYSKDNPLFVNNLAGYYLVKKDFKKAQKYIDQVLKKHPDDMTALKNGMLLARTKKDTKREKKDLELMAANGETETDRASAKARLEALGKK